MTIQQKLKQDQKEIVERVRNGEYTTTLAKEYNCNPGTIYQFLQKIGVSTNITYKGRGKKEKYKNRIIRLHKDGISAYKISKELEIGKRTVLRWLKDWGYSCSDKAKRDDNNLLKDKKDEVIQLFENGVSCGKIGERLGHSGSNIGKLLKKHNYDPQDFKIKVDETYFNIIDTQNKAYILGWMYSDGNVMPEGKFRICLAEKDKHIVYWIKDQIKYEGNIHYRKPRNGSKAQYELCINRKVMVDDLISLGCVPNKSLIIKLPDFNQIPQNLYHHFVRGYFDGDGSINNGIMICGSYYFVYELQKLLPCKATNIYQRYKDRDPLGSAHQLFIGQRSEVLKFKKWLYEDAEMFLERKFNLFP